MDAARRGAEIWDEAAVGPVRPDHHPVRRLLVCRNRQDSDAEDYGSRRYGHHHEDGHVYQRRAVLKIHIRAWRSLIVRIVAVALGLSCARETLAQSTAQIPLQFDLQTPGARSMAM